MCQLGPDSSPGKVVGVAGELSAGARTSPAVSEGTDSGTARVPGSRTALFASSLPSWHVFLGEPLLDLSHAD